MSVQPLPLLLLLLLLTLLTHGQSPVYSNASLSLSLSSESRSLVGAEASTHGLHFLLKNRGAPRLLEISQAGLEGRLETREVFLLTGQFTTLRCSGALDMMADCLPQGGRLAGAQAGLGPLHHPGSREQPL